MSKQIALAMVFGKFLYEVQKYPSTTRAALRFLLEQLDILYPDDDSANEYDLLHALRTRWIELEPRLHQLWKDFLAAHPVPVTGSTKITISRSDIRPAVDAPVVRDDDPASSVSRN